MKKDNYKNKHAQPSKSTISKPPPNGDLRCYKMITATLSISEILKMIDEKDRPDVIKAVKLIFDLC